MDRHSITIDLKNHMRPGISSFDSPTWGIKLRHELRIERLFAECDELIIKIPKEANNISIGFFEELFKNIIEPIDQFRKKLKIDDSLSSLDVKAYVDYAVNSICTKRGIRIREMELAH